MATGAVGILARWPPRQFTRLAQAFFTAERCESRHFLLAFWFSLRLLMVCFWLSSGRGASGDVNYYFDHLSVMNQAGAAQTMQEYPTPVLWVLSLPMILGLGNTVGYAVAFACLMLTLDALFTLSLWRFGGARRGQAIIVWSLFLTLTGPTAYLRFDLVTSVLAGWALIAAWRKRPVIAGAIISLAAAVKLWPALLWPALCGGSRPRAWRVTIAMAVTGGALALGSIAWAGWDRLLSPLTYQSDRGLQVESVFASVPMLLRALHIGDYAVTVSRYQAFEIWGTGVSYWLAAVSIAAIAGYVVIAAVYVAWLVRGHGRMIEGCVLTLLVITILIVTNKTFSPQYIIWIGGPLAVTVLVAGQKDANDALWADPAVEKRQAARVTWLILAAAFATVLVFPLGYSPLVRDVTGWTHVMRLPVSVVLVLRNAMMVWLLAELSVWTASFLKPGVWARRRRAQIPAGDTGR